MIRNSQHKDFVEALRLVKELSSEPTNQRNYEKR